MLAAIEVVTPEQLAELRAVLLEALELAQRGAFTIERADEDGHTALERFLTQRTAAGARVHTGRSRNDQVMAALRLYGREALTEAAAFRAGPGGGAVWPSPRGIGAHRHAGAHPYPGGDALHRRPVGGGLRRGAAGRPGPAGHLLPADQSIAVGICRWLRGRRYRWIASRWPPCWGAMDPCTTCSPLPTAAASWEAVTLDALDQVAMTASRLAQDLILFSLPELGYLTLPVELCTGSSIMPHKRNPGRVGTGAGAGGDRVRSRRRGEGHRAQPAQRLSPRPAGDQAPLPDCLGHGGRPGLR